MDWLTDGAERCPVEPVLGSFRNAFCPLCQVFEEMIILFNLRDSLADYRTPIDWMQNLEALDEQAHMVWG
jgi:hypothetical protein